MNDGSDPGKHAAPEHIVMAPVKGNSLAEYGIVDGDCLVIDTRLRPDDGGLGLVRCLQGELIAHVIYVGDGSLILYTEAEMLVFSADDEVEVAGRVTAVQHYFG